MTTKIEALANYLITETSEIDEISYDDCAFEAEGNEYLVLTDSEADERAADYILDSLWTFNASFIIAHSDLPSEAQEMIENFQREKCEDANGTIAAMISDLENFVDEAISADGRGHFLSSYDGEENEFQIGDEAFYIYRTN